MFSIKVPSVLRGRQPATELSSQFRQLVDASREAMLLVDEQLRIRHFNGPAGSLFGYDRERLRNQPIQRLFPGQPLPLFGVDRTGGKKQSGARLALVGSRSDSVRFPAEVDVIPLKTRHGLLAVLVVMDMTEARRAQLALERTLEVLTSTNRDRQLLLAHLDHAQEEERKRIAAGIHDDSIQVISAAHLRLQQLRNRLQRPADVAIVDKLDEALQLSLDRLHQLIFDLRPTGLQGCSLAAALRTSLDAMRSTSGIAYELEYETTTAVAASTSMLIYRTIQEALTNVRKHARATTVRVQLSHLDNGHLIRITDDGVGYDPADVEDRPGHLGLVLMRERPQLAGGWSRIESSPGAGTTVEFWVPAELPSGAETAA